MSFSLPEVDEILSRLWRLRRLICLGAAIPALIWLGIGLLFWPFTGSGPDGYLVLWLFTALILAGHGVLFPNATEESVAIAMGFAALTLIEPLLGFSLLARVAELAALVAVVVFVPRRLVGLLARSRAVTMTSRARVVSESTAEKARRHFPPRPGLELPFRLCGAAGPTGEFPLTLAPSGPVAMDADRDPRGPHVWARILRDDPAEQETAFLLRSDAGSFEPASVVTHAFAMVAEGVRVTETEVVEGFPVGLAALLWLTDYQQDGLVASRDVLEGRTSMALRFAPRDTLAGLVTATIRPGWAARWR